MPQSGMIALKSFQSFMINDGLLEKVVEAIKAGEKEARTTGDIQTFEVFYKGFRQNIAIGRVMVIPAKVADSRDTFPIALLYGTLIRQFGGEEMADLINYKIGDNEFDEYSKADLSAIKDKVFKNSDGKFESLVMFAPSWWNKREFITFKFTKDDAQLSNLVRHLVFSAYFDPALSSAFNALMTDVSTDKLDVTNVTPKLNFPGIAENPLKDYPDMQKMGAGRKKIFLTKKTAAAIEEQQLEPAELDVFAELNTVIERGLGVEPLEDVAKHEGSVKTADASAELIEDFADDFMGCQFTWISGREKGMIFEPTSFEPGSDAHFRGTYTNHPQFGNIDDDMHQANALIEDVANGAVRVTEGDLDRTPEATQKADEIQEAQNAGYESDDEEEEMQPDEAQAIQEANDRARIYSSAVNASKKACGELPVVEGTNIGPGKAAENQEPPKPADDLNGPEGTKPLGIELNADGTPAREETGKSAAGEKTDVSRPLVIGELQALPVGRAAQFGQFTVTRSKPNYFTVAQNGTQVMAGSAQQVMSFLPRAQSPAPVTAATECEECEGEGCKFCNNTGVKKGSVKTAEPAAGAAPAMAKQETVLYNQQNGSDKEYRVVMTPHSDGQWSVAAFNGKRGKATTQAQSFGPMNQAAAKQKYDELVAAKTSGGYTRTLEEQPKAPGSDNAQALPARGQGSVIQFENATQVALYKGWIIGQMSDGAWENSDPRDHWRPMAQAEVRVGKPGMNFSPRRTYGIVGLLKYISDEMLATARATKAYPDVDWTKLAHAVSYVVDTPAERIKEDWQQKYVAEVLKATGETDIAQVVARINGQAYGMGELRKDLRAMQNVINGKWHQDNDARFASIMKAARDRNEEMKYAGHTFRLTTWEERDRLNINLTDECCDREVLNLWDDDARSAIEDGFIDPRKMIQSAIKYAESLGLMTDIVGDEGQGVVHASLVDASSEASRQAAAKHDVTLAKRYAGRKRAEEVPTADSILNEVLTDIGQAPIVKVPGMDNQPATQPEAQNVPEPMKSETPEKSKAEAKPEQSAKPFEATARKRAAQKIADVMDLLERSPRYGYSKHMAGTVDGDLADAKSEITFDKSDVADNGDVDQSTPNELFGKEASDEDYCEACQQHKPCSCDDMEQDRKKANDNNRNDDVPVAEGAVSEDKKQPTSDLSGAAPEAHDAWPQVDSKVAFEEAEWEVIVGNIGQVYSGFSEEEARSVFSDYQVREEGRSVGEPVTLMHNGEIVEETGNLVSYPDDPMTDEELATPNMIDDIMSDFNYPGSKDHY